MKKQIVFILMGILTFFVTTSFDISTSKSYDVVKIYTIEDLAPNSKMVDNFGHIKEAKSVLVPTSLDRGKYQVDLTKIDSNFYRIVDSNYVIETQYCYEYAYRDDAILNITSTYGYSLGEVVFLD